MATTTANPPPPQPDPTTQSTRLQEIKQFDESKIGVKGLVDRGLPAIPSFFIHPKPAELNPKDPNNRPGTKPTIPVIDFSSSRSTIVDEIRRASSTLGFFQIINHSVPVASIKKILGSIQEFYELPEDAKMEYYTRDMSRGAAYSTNFDLYQSKAASWRDTFQMGLAPNPPKWENVPFSCRETVAGWDKEVVKISEEVLEILSEGLGLEKKDKLKELSDGRVMAAHYYPYCPQAELTAGLTSHTDPGLLTVLVQNEVPGLQVKVGEDWVDVVPVEGAIVFNIGDNLQIMSNDQYKSVEHRVLANPLRDSRVSVAVFLKPSLSDQLCGPFPELVSAEKPAVYRQFTLSDYMGRFFSKELDGKTLTNYYRI
ncbi:1-aminocyclopropane-1-carboxylate oxidase homolog 3-like isoform X2 [Coffea eugenioides]|uniref:1-aminocyclopropane-1-carboxylate oxidase homolog 3-like isoform X2 n=1 Tax=Coffea eugenioides TaxID=49369 RepID=UPI000F615247|nr:1-aminocyclopropane-1-carboxylate oxidase homolog 3-like isoform X2 [Coffea eugenioides]